jgi:exosortase
MEPSAPSTTQAESLTAVKCQWQDLGVHQWLKAAAIAALFHAVFHAELSRIMGRWLSDPSWSHGFLIPLFSLYFVNQRKRDIVALEHRACYWGLLLLVAAIGVYVFNTVSPAGYAYFRSCSLVLALGAIVLLLGGWGLIRYTWLPLAYLLFAIPLPQRAYVALTMPMRKLAAVIAAALLNLVYSVETSVNGVVIDIVHQGQAIEPSLNVAEACSGMRLLMAFLALGVAMAYLHERPWGQRLALLGASIPIAVICNVIRVTATGFIYVFIHPKYTQGIYHDALGMAMLPLAFGLYGGLAWFMASLYIEEDADKASPDVIVRRDRDGVMHRLK